ncbi:MAG: GHKL domain-containing protein [Bdellovibrionales bacterium]|nr:GHKL domain-containing protein [Bdellovibrionales bacterium]
MSELRSSVLIIGHPCPQSIELGADFLEEAPENPQDTQAFCNVIAIRTSDDNFHKVDNFLKMLKDSRPQLQKILICENLEYHRLQKLVNAGSVFQILKSYSHPNFEQITLQALEAASLQKQRNDLQMVASQQNTRLKSLTSQLEAMVSKRGKNLIRSRKRLLTTTKKVTSLHKALMAIHNANSIGEMGGLLTEALSDYLELDWTRIFFAATSSFSSQNKPDTIATFAVPLLIESQSIGEIVFARALERPFSKEQQEFLNQIAEGVSLAINRLTKHDQAESLKQQWEATFDAISDSLCIVDENFQILRFNKAYANNAISRQSDFISRDAFSTFFGEKQPHGMPEPTDNFEFKTVRQEDSYQSTFLVSCQTTMEEENSSKIRMILFRNITDELRMERQILESAKMAEIGTIGSSIAHELNNPLGGMISFLQLIKMDCSQDDPQFADIDEMEKAAQKCKEIIENLLGFSRRSNSLEVKETDLKEVLHQSIKITELQTRSRGIQTQLKVPDDPVTLVGSFNLLAQALCNLLQNSYEAIYSIVQNNPRYDGHIEISLWQEKDQIFLTIDDNGAGISTKHIYQIFNPLFSTKNPDSHSGLGLTVAQKIIKDHGGTLEIIARTEGGTQAKIAFHRPESST